MTTSAATLLAILGPVLVALLAGVGWLVLRVVSHDTALAVLVEQVNPPNKPSLRDLLGDLKTEVAVTNARNIRRDTT